MAASHVIRVICGRHERRVSFMPGAIPPQKKSPILRAPDYWRVLHRSSPTTAILDVYLEPYTNLASQLNVNLRGLAIPTEPDTKSCFWQFYLGSRVHISFVVNMHLVRWQYMIFKGSELAMYSEITPVADCELLPAHSRNNSESLRDRQQDDIVPLARIHRLLFGFTSLKITTQKLTAVPKSCCFYTKPLVSATQN